MIRELQKIKTEVQTGDISAINPAKIQKLITELEASRNSSNQLLGQLQSSKKKLEEDRANGINYGYGGRGFPGWG